MLTLCPVYSMEVTAFDTRRNSILYIEKISITTLD